MASPQSRSRLLGKPEYFTQYKIKHLEKEIRIVAPILNFSGNKVELGYTIGTRTNGIDVASWPNDLTVEVIT